MKKGCILWLLISVISLPLVAQNIIYSNLKELMAQDGDTLSVLRVEKRSRSQILLTGGADYRITAGNDESMCRQLRSVVLQCALLKEICLSTAVSCDIKRCVSGRGMLRLFSWAKISISVRCH